MIKKWNDFKTNENLGDITDDSNYFVMEDIQTELEDMIKKTVDNIGGDMKSFIKSYLSEESEEDIKIEGLINDSDIFDFYIKWRNDIDQILTDSNYFDEPEEAFTLYDIIIKGTMKAVELVIERIEL